MAALGLVEVRTGRVEMGLRGKIVGLLHFEGFERVCQLVPLRRVQVEGVVRTETRTLSQPVGALGLGFYLHLHLRPFEGEVKQRILPELGLGLLLDLCDRAIVPVLRRLDLIRLAFLVLHIFLLDPDLLGATLARVLDPLDKLLDIGQVVLVELCGVEGVVKDGALELGLLRQLLALHLLPVAQLAGLNDLLQDGHLDLFVSFELFADGGVDVPQSSPQYRVELVFYIVLGPAFFIAYLPVKNLEI